MGSLASVFFISLGFLGFFPTRLRRLSLGGMGPLCYKFGKRLGRWPTYVFFGQCGRKGTC